jgi:hypothetical protein
MSVVLGESTVRNSNNSNVRRILAGVGRRARILPVADNAGARMAPMTGDAAVRLDSLRRRFAQEGIDALRWFESAN